LANEEKMDTPLIPRKVLFGNPEKARVSLSPDGKKIAYIAPKNGVLNVWVAPRDQLEAAQPVTNDTGRGIRFYEWAHTNDHILYIQDKNGDENWRLYGLDLSNQEVKDFTPFENVTAQIAGVSHKLPQEIMVGINNRDPQWHDLYRLNIRTGEMILVEKNESFMGFFLDEDYRVLGAMRMTPDGGAQLFRRAEGQWQPWETIGQEDMLTTDIVCSDKSGQKVYMRDSRGRNTSALFEKDLATGEARLLAEDPHVDVGGILLHPTERTVQAVAFTYDHTRWQILDPSLQADFDYLRTVTDGEASISSNTLDQQYMIVTYLQDNQPVKYYLYDRQKREARYLFSNRKDLEQYPLVKMHPVVIKSRDGLDLVAYYSLPPGSDSNADGVPDQPLPMVFTPHGGPWGRDGWGLNPWHQWLANRGYAVLMVNFRSSTGFGKAFINAGDKEWGGKVMEDQVDAVQWAVAQGIADPQKIAVMGGSFGGYSTLAGITMYPDLFACGVDLVGPSNLITLLESMPPYWRPMLEMFTTRVGDHRTEEGRALLRRHSPLTYVDHIRRPLLIGQGKNDPRVKQAESDQIVKAMQEKGIPVTYLLYPDEGHGFARPENNLSFNAIAEIFLAECLGGRYQPIGDDFENSSLQVLAGAEKIAGLNQALEEKGLNT
jgi:dipeptidyl aminopeptidase/acylaminoacyl peptidase